MKTKNFEKGRVGELIAKKYLQNKGYCIIEENYRTKYAEIDLIAWENGALVFVEVRTKTGECFGSPEESINRNKIKKLIRNAEAYTAIKRYSKVHRIDAICIVLDKRGGANRISHHQNIID